MIDGEFLNIIEQIKELSYKPKRAHSPLSSSELEAQLSKIWDSTNIAAIREKTEANDVSEYQQDFPTSPATQRNQLKMEWPKEQSRWPVVIIILAMFLGVIARFGPTMIENANRRVPVSTEIMKTIEATQEHLAQEKESTSTDENKQVVEKFIQNMSEDTIEHSITTIVSEDYESIILKNINYQFMKKLGNADIEKVFQPNTGLSITYFLIVNEEENINVIVEVAFKQITHMYAENFNQSEEEELEYQSLWKKWI
ncbi:hypothetical protein CWR48_16320 [Oceanobacillus arenosus]|uniref:Uncharacterized protein n=1 Tax=Oceanobacillus arenosus TaxID=1229153 RepID=A0A3D8PK47_9BACI|nr:hypothetical protein [Oceanobacillus arenosus]RDW16450.1 hypothetical protein CWR48_16320 [Oceanobacillus arenosus]